MAERKPAAPKKRAPAKVSAAPATSSSESQTNTEAAAAPASASESELVVKDRLPETAEPTSVVKETAPVEIGAAAIAENAAAPKASPDNHEHHVARKTHPKPIRVLDVFLIDSGWNTPVCAAVHENVPAVSAYLKGHRFFVLNQDQSLTYIKHHPSLIGADPILLVVDRKISTTVGGCGFRLCLGHVRQPEVAVSMLKWAMQLTMTASSTEMVNLIRKSAHRESLQGAIELIGEGSAHLLEFAPV